MWEPPTSAYNSSTLASTHHTMADFLRSTRWDDLIRNKPLAAGLGLLTHYILNNGEWDHEFYYILPSWGLTFGTLAAIEYVTDPRVSSILGAAQVVAVAAATYFGAFFASVLIYRGFFHRLRNYPGPFMSRLTKFYSVARVADRRCQYYHEIEAQHKKYKTDIIRTGPRELSVASADAVPLIHGAMSKCSKAVWYNGSYFLEGSSVHTTRSKQDHRERRKLWDRAFNAKALREYEPRLNRHGLALITKLKELANEPSLRLSNWINFYSFDVMGDIGFSRSFGMLEKGEEDELIKSLHKSMAPFSYMSHVSWIMGLILRTSVGAKDILEFMSWTREILMERKKTTPSENDVFGWLLDPNEESIPLHLNADTRLMIVAGSDTTAATLTWLCYELCRNPKAQAKLRKIIDEIEPEKSFLEAGDLNDCPHLDGIINEAMRLHPAVPSGVQRETPPEGITLPDQRYIPGETLIWMPVHTMQRDERYFPSPLEFMPERWTDEKPEFIQDKRAFMPFSTGIYGCVGQKLAMMEMRNVVANLVRNFEINFVGNDKGESVVRETRDCFTLNVGPLDVKLTQRNRAANGVAH